MQREHHKTLVLNADYTAIGIIGWEKAITLEFKGLVKVIDFYKGDEIRCTGNASWPCPAVIVLKQYQQARKKTIPFSRKNVFIRDKLTCQYCNKRFGVKQLTFDHVIPRCKWKSTDTPTCWENIVTCCYPCNNKKADKTLKESGMSIIKYPHRPNPTNFVLGLAPWSKLQKEWIPYIPQNYKDIMEINL